MIDTIVIDFGTSRTKAAYYNPESQQPTLIRLGEREYVSSVFYVEKGGKILFGDSAQVVLENQKVGSRNDSKPIRGLKLELSEMHTRRGKRYSAVDLLTPLFTYIRERAANLEGFDKAYPTKVILTTTKRYRPSDTEALRGAAQNAGFEDITVITEPESVAKGWVTATQPDRTDVIVLDCGGGTVDWTYLHRENRNFRVKPALRGNACKVGGHDVDEALARILDLQLERDSCLLNKISNIKEMFCEGIEELPPISIGSRFVKLDGRQIKQAILNAFINPVCNEIEPFIEDVKKATRRGNPAILLVGGSAKLHGLKCVLKRKFECEVNPDWPNTEYAPVLGAVPIPDSGQTPKSGQTPEERLDAQVAGHFHELAELIGEPQDSEVEFVVGEETHKVVPGLQMSRTHKEKLRGRAAMLAKGSLRLTVLGEFSTGKSTLVNAILGQDILPTAEGTCTSVPTEVVFGSNDDQATVVEINDKKRIIPFKEFYETYCFGPDEQPKAGGVHESRPGRFEGIEYVQLESKSEFSGKGIRLVDTLGIDSDNLSDDITSEFLAQTDTSLVVVTDLSQTMREFMDKYVKRKVVASDAGREVSGYEHIFFVLHDHGTWAVTKEKNERKDAEDNLRSQLRGIMPDSLYDSRVFTVNGRDALDVRMGRLTHGERSGIENLLLSVSVEAKNQFRSDLLSQGLERLDKTGILKLEDALLKFMESTDGALVIAESAVDQVLIPALDAFTKHVAEAQAVFNKTETQLECHLSKARTALSDLRKMVKKCQVIAREFAKNKSKKIVDYYQYSLESFLSDKQFEDLWKTNLKGHMKEGLTSEEDLKKALLLIESEINSFIQSGLSSAANDTNTQFSLSQMIKDDLEPITKDFFGTLNGIVSGQTDKGVLNSTERIEIQIEDVFSSRFDMPYISLTGEREVLSFIVRMPFIVFFVWGLVGFFRDSRIITAKKTILDKLADTRKELLDGSQAVKQINHLNEQVSTFTDRVVTRLNSEIEVVERWLADISNTARDKTVEKERFEKITSLFEAKFEEISRAVFGRVLNREELRARVAQSRQTEAD